MHNLTWKKLLSKERNAKYFKKILAFLTKEKNLGKTILPEKNSIFNVFRYTELFSINVVILGQDPYYNPLYKAHGIAFSVLPNIKIPPSLYNIYIELSKDIDNFIIPKHGFLKKWSEQGVFLLNTILTVESGKPNSHKNIGWEIFTDKVINIINIHLKNVVFILWGEHARKKRKLIDNYKHLILESSHPSPLSAYRGFFGCRHFSKTNNFLSSHNKKIIKW